MRLENLIKPMDDMSDAELMERLREIRHNRETARPAAAARQKRADSKGKVSSKKVTQLETLLASLSPEDRLKLFEGLGE